MTTNIEEFNGVRARVRFQPGTEVERQLLAAVRTNRPLDDSQQLTLMDWVEQALARRGYPECSVLDFEGVQNSIDYIFRVEQTL